MKPTGLFWWIDRWRKSSAYMDMTLEQQGAYRNLLDEAHLRGGPLPNDERILAKASGDAISWERVREVVMGRFELCDDGCWHNETMDEVYARTMELSVERRKAGRIGGIRSGEARRQAKHEANVQATPPSKTPSQTNSPSPSPSPSPDLVSVSGSQGSINKPLGGAHALSTSKNNGKAAPPAHSPVNGNGNGHVRKPKDNLAVITKLVHTVLADINHPQDFASLKTDIKTQCAVKHIAYDAEVVGRALESALARRKHA